MLSNNGLCLPAAAQYMLLFLVLAVNSTRFRILPLRKLHALTIAAHSYALIRVLARPFPKGTVPFGGSNVPFGSAPKPTMCHLAPPQNQFILVAT